MKYALVDKVRTEATKGAKGICPSCQSELVAKCGEVIIHHWAHKASRNCDSWWENETEWHRNWKNHFPVEWQEVVQFDEKGEKHIADVKTEEDWVIEFQHSYLKPEERSSRNEFYKKIVWVVDGLRRKRDLPQLDRLLQESSQAPVRNVNIRQISFPEESKLLNEWLECKVPVFFDFNGKNKMNNSVIWFLLPVHIKETAYLVPYSYENFAELHRNKGFDEIVNEIIPNIQSIIVEYNNKRSSSAANTVFNRMHRKKTYRRRF